ncbi:MAG: hypothetical protein KDC98_20950 [Planctomycetes bacterium]|nr:hypothetical protein [Planctomycetota bacterium]
MATELAGIGTGLGIVEFANMVGRDPDELPAACVATILQSELEYDVLTGRQREARLLEALRGSDRNGMPPSGPGRAIDWERGWSENLRDFEARGYAPETLIPRYNKYDVLRYRGDYVRVADRGFEYSVYTALRHYCFARWFADCDAVTEFGCGTGTSLLLLAETMPQLRLCGCDWAPSSQEILHKLGERLGISIAARRFDMFQPDPALELGPGAGVFTSAAMEQLGCDHGAFVDFLLARRPRICVHIEPIYELYDGDDLFDEVARRYHLHRNYLRGFLPRLRELADRGDIELLEARRSGLGSFFHEGYSIVVWRPAARGSGR